MAGAWPGGAQCLGDHQQAHANGKKLQRAARWCFGAMAIPVAVVRRSVNSNIGEDKRRALSSAADVGNAARKSESVSNDAGAAAQATLNSNKQSR